MVNDEEEFEVEDIITHRLVGLPSDAWVTSSITCQPHSQATPGPHMPRLNLSHFQINELASAKNPKLTNLHFQLTKFTQALSRVK